MRRLVTVLVLTSLLAGGLSLVSFGRAASPAPVDPRSGGFTIGLGEWAVAPETPAVRPGRVTFVVRNSGKELHGFRIKQDDDRRGRDRFEARTITLEPGQTTRLTVTLPAGVYSIECFVEGHDDLGMERRLEVREDAPLVRPKSTGGSVVEIKAFAYNPQTIRTRAGTTVRWTNLDPAAHTVSASTFDSGTLRKGGKFSRRFAKPGTFAYLCILHPQMRGKVVVSR